MARKKAPKAKVPAVVVDEQMLKDNPVLAEAGVKVGDEGFEVEAVTVTWKGQSRQYSLAVHGKDFVALAHEFATKHGGVVTTVA